MTGALIIGELLRADAALAALVPEERIKAGRLPDDVALPAVLVRIISENERQKLKRTGWERVIALVSVSVCAESYRQKDTIIGLVRSCCAGRTGDVGGGKSVSILTAGKGPDLIGPGNSFEQSQDFRVSFDALV